jgi:hypothetical protein
VARRGWFGSEHESPGSDSYVGLTRAAALEAAQKAGTDTIRVFESASGTYTLDFRPSRPDLLIEEDVVVAAGFF